MSEQLSAKMFHSNWHVEHKRYKEMIKIAMVCSLKPVKISAVGIFDINIGTFLRICNSAYSLFAVFKRVS